VVWKAVARTALAMLVCWKAGLVAAENFVVEAACRSRDERAIDAMMSGTGGGQLVRLRCVVIAWCSNVRAAMTEQRDLAVVENGCRASCV
jgi:hypothetical protein